MEQTQQVETPAVPKPRKKARTRRRVRSAAVPKPKVTDPVTLGLTAAECPVECSANGCVISGKPYCAHPRKGGLHAEDMVNRDALDRSQRAKKALAHMVVDKRQG